MPDAKTPAYKPDVRWVITIRESAYHGGERYVHLTARAAIAGWDHDGKFGIFDPHSYSLPYRQANRELHGLQITAQSDTNHMRHPGSEFYGWEFAYDRPTVDPAAARDIARVLARIKRKMETLTRELGRPATLAQYITYVARTFAPAGTSRVFVRYIGDGREDDYEHTGYRSMDADDLAGFIWHECAQWRKRYGIEVPADA